MKNILEKIKEKKKDVLKIYKNTHPENKLLNNIKNIKNPVNFSEKINKRNFEKKLSIIAEIKKASPSAGQIIKDFDPLNIAKIYIENGASFLSVLTEENFFLGKLDYIKTIKDNYKIPILCKDFFIDTYQIALAKSFGADCILIILSALDLELAKDIYQAANDLDISTLVEVHTENEAEIALKEFMETPPTHERYKDAHYWYGDTFRVRQLYQDAATAYLDGYHKYPKSSKAPVNLLKLGVMLVQIGEKEQGCSMILGVKEQYPKANQSVMQKAEYEKKKFNCEKKS